LTNSGTITADANASVGILNITTYTNSGTTTLPATVTITAVATFTNSGTLGGVSNLTVTGATTFTHTGTIPNLSTLTIGGSGTTTFSYNKNTNWSFGNLIINSGGILTHAANIATKQYAIDFTLSGNLSINGTGTINVDGKGYTTASGSGAGGTYTSGTLYGSNMYYYGAGSGYGGNGGYSYGSTTNGGITYGSPTAPTDLGSGGGSSGGYGGAGGGAVKLSVAGTSTINGTISANGTAGTSYSYYYTSSPSYYYAYYYGGSGSGGSIWIDTGTLAGTSTLRANGGTAYDTSEGAGGGGRIAVTYNSISSGTLTKNAYGGSAGYQLGGAGTIYTKNKPSQTNGDLLIDNSTYNGASTTQIAANFTFDTITIQNNGKYVIPSGYSLTAATLFNTTGSSLTNNGTLIVSGTNF
jgi:hypothetical protein